MPPRLVCVLILLYWAIAAVCLITRDVLPELTIGSPPDLRTIARAEEHAQPSRWSVQVIDEPLSPESRRTVGHAITSSTRRKDGWVEMKSEVSFDSGGLLKGTPFESSADVQLEIRSTYVVNPLGNLHSFQAIVKSEHNPDELLSIEGKLKDGVLDVVSKGPLPIMNRKRSFPYPARSMVQNAIGPIDRLPGLQVGQRWDTRVVSPFTGRMDTVRVEVTRRSVIHWDGNPVTTFEVVEHLTPMSARTWVRPDGLVLRQEVPFPLVKLVLERQPDDAKAPSPEVSAR
jgi:hypothetical protein